MSLNFTRYIPKIPPFPTPANGVAFQPFSNSYVYSLVNSFILGTKIESDVMAASDCFDSTINMIDDFSYLMNNISLSSV